MTDVSAMFNDVNIRRQNLVKQIEKLSAEFFDAFTTIKNTLKGHVDLVERYVDEIYELDKLNYLDRYSPDEKDEDACCLWELICSEDYTVVLKDYDILSMCHPLSKDKGKKKVLNPNFLQLELYDGKLSEVFEAITQQSLKDIDSYSSVQVSYPSFFLRHNADKKIHQILGDLRDRVIEENKDYIKKVKDQEKQRKLELEDKKRRAELAQKEQRRQMYEKLKQEFEVPIASW